MKEGRRQDGRAKRTRSNQGVMRRLWMGWGGLELMTGSVSRSNKSSPNMSERRELVWWIPGASPGNLTGSPLLHGSTLSEN